eukprot:889882-Pyramimonas_sp.AAC.1
MRPHFRVKKLFSCFELPSRLDAVCCTLFRYDQQTTSQNSGGMDEGELRDRFNSAAFVSPTGGEEVRSCWCAHVESRYISPGTCLLLLSVSPASAFVRDREGPWHEIPLVAISLTLVVCTCWDSRILSPRPLLAHLEIGCQIAQQRGFPEAHEESNIRWQRGELIGAGAFGRVYVGMNEDSGQLLAVKQVAVYSPGVVGKERQEEHLAALESEVAVLRNLSHPNIV